MNRLEYARWALHVLNRSAELRWKYGPLIERAPAPGAQPDLDLPKLRRELGADGLAHVLALHRDLLSRSAQAPQAFGQSASAQGEAAPIWERPAW